MAGRYINTQFSYRVQRRRRRELTGVVANTWYRRARARYNWRILRNAVRSQGRIAANPNNLLRTDQYFN